MKIIILGGDNRQIYLCENLINSGYDALHITSGKNLKEYIKESDVIILPIPSTKDNTTVFNTFSNEKIFISDLKEFLDDQLVLTANINLENKNCLDYSQKDAFTIKNAIPTAEAAIALAVGNSENMLFGSNCLVVGYGKIGKILSHYLKCLGANVTASARKESDLSYIYSNGIEHIKTSEINKVADKFDFIFNTVNAFVINDAFLKNVKESALILELASLPGGISGDRNICKGQIINARGLPGKYSPKAASKILTETVLDLISEYKGEAL